MESKYFDETILLSSIANLDDNDERVKYFLLNLEFLSECQMIFVDEEHGTNKTGYLNGVVDLGYEVNSLFYSNKLYCVSASVLGNAFFGSHRDLSIISLTKNKKHYFSILKL